RAFSAVDSDFFVTERYFSPNGDGVKDTTRFLYRLDAPQPVTVRAVDRRGRTEWTAGPFTSDGGDVTWDGTSDAGQIVRDGTFRFEVVAEDGAVVGAAAVTVDNNRAPLLRAAGTLFENHVNLTCLMPSISDDSWLSDDEQWFYSRVSSPEGTPFRRGIHRVSLSDFRTSEVFGENGEFPFDLVIAGDASKIAWVSRNLSATQFWLWLADGDGGNRVEVDAGSSPSWSPVGFSASAEYFLYFQFGRLMRVRTDGPGAPEEIFDASSTPARVEGAVLLSPDRRTLAVDATEDEPGGVHLIDIAAGTSTELATTSSAQAFSFSVDGQRLVAGEADRVVVFDRAGRELASYALPAST
ncbi:MAG: hypothetical protein AAFX50_25585, partial [Acidobacteriota bacterium]